MYRLALLLAAVLAALTTPARAEAQTYYYRYAYVPLRMQPATAQPAAVRFASPLATVQREARAAYGPFRVLDDTTAALVGATDSRSPGWFQAMLRDYPRLATLRLVECPGTYDDRANLALGRMIRAAGMAIDVPAGGSVRSGAVELALAGTSLTIDDRARFAVHAWLDEYGRGASDYAADSPEHRKYFAYYREMGMNAGQAASFYAMTNSTPFERPRWLSGAEMRNWVGRGASGPVLAESELAVVAPAPVLALSEPAVVTPAPVLATVEPTTVSTVPVGVAAPEPAVVLASAPALTMPEAAVAASAPVFALAEPAFAAAVSPFASAPVAFAPATVFLTPIPVPVVSAAPRLAYLDLGLTVF